MSTLCLSVYLSVHVGFVLSRERHAYVPPLPARPASVGAVVQRRSGSAESQQRRLSNQRPILLNHRRRMAV